MKRTVQTLQDEHNGVLTVLEQLDRAVAAAEGDIAVPPAIFADIQEFFKTFVDRCHHSKEERVLFPALGDSGAGLQRRLEEQHATGCSLAGTYAQSVAAYSANEGDAVRRLADAARAYAAFLREHIDLETRELLPLVERTLSPASDESVTEAFERIEVEEIGEGTHERLHGMIGGLASRIDAADVRRANPDRQMSGNTRQTGRAATH